MRVNKAQLRVETAVGPARGPTGGLRKLIMASGPAAAGPDEGLGLVYRGSFIRLSPQLGQYLVPVSDS